MFVGSIYKFSTLPNNLTELLNWLWVGPTSDKSLGTLFMLSLYRGMYEVFNFRLPGILYGSPFKAPAVYIL